jgi:hypothetical protein
MPGKLDNIKDDALRTSLEAVHQQLRKNQPTDAVKNVTAVFLGMLNDHPELLERTVAVRQGMQMPIVMRWPALGANLDFQSIRAKQPKIDFIRDHFAMSEAITYYEFTVDTALREGL